MVCGGADAAAGKTTLLRALSGKPVEEQGMTEGIAIEEMHLQGVTFRSWDCGGQAEYQNTHPIFFSEARALYLVVFNLRDGVATAEAYLRTARSLVPAASVVLVGTHLDEVSGCSCCDRR